MSSPWFKVKNFNRYVLIFKAQFRLNRKICLQVPIVDNLLAINVDTKYISTLQFYISISVLAIEIRYLK